MWASLPTWRSQSSGLLPLLLSFHCPNLPCPRGPPHRQSLLGSPHNCSCLKTLNSYTYNKQLGENILSCYRILSLPFLLLYWPISFPQLPCIASAHPGWRIMNAFIFSTSGRIGITWEVLKNINTWVPL